MSFKSRHSGFVLYEAIVALMISIMTLGILQQSLQILHNVQNTSFREQVRWHITQERLQELLSKNKVTRVYEDKIYYINEESKTMVIDRYNFKMIRIQSADHGGHEPIMTGIQKINFEKFDNLVIITTENKAGQKSQMCIIVDS